MSKGSNYIVLGILDHKTRLVADRHGFMLQMKREDKNKKTVWASQYYYSELGAAIRGYAKHTARRRKNKTAPKTLMDLLDLVSSLEKKIVEIGDRLSKEWRTLMEDPIERSIAEGNLHD
jgi:hypothetical protein